MSHRAEADARRLALASIQRVHNLKCRRPDRVPAHTVEEVGAVGFEMSRQAIPLIGSIQESYLTLRYPLSLVISANSGLITKVFI